MRSLVILFWSFCMSLFPSYGLSSSNEEKTPELGNVQIKGSPEVIHYTKQDYNSDSQFWSMTEDNEGTLYFGNNDGISIYDGERWRLLKFPNGSTARGLKFASDGNVYVGGYNQIGIIKKNSYGHYYFESLIELLRPEDRNFNDIWQITEINDYIVFRSFKQLIAIKNRLAITLPAEGWFRHMKVIGNKLYMIDDWGIKTLSLKSMEFDNLIPANDYNQDEISSLLAGRTDNELVAFSKDGNSYLIDLQNRNGRFYKKHIEKGSNDQIFCAFKDSNNQFYLGTINSMLQAIDLFDESTSEILYIDNLQNHTVLNLYQTRDGNIWVLLNKGLDCIKSSSPQSKIFDNAAIYDVVFFNNKIYLATNQGLYVADYQNNQKTLVGTDFKIFPGLEAQAWTLNVFKNKLIVGHDKGVFVIEGNSYYHVQGTTGIWKVIEANGTDNLFLACAYDGIFVLNYNEHGKFVLRNQIDGFEISGRDILPTNDPYTYWICHGFKGVFRIKIDQNYQRTTSREQYTDQNGLPSPYGNNIYIWKKDTVFTTVSGVYKFIESSKQFVQHEQLTGILGENTIHKILYNNQKTWFVRDEQIGYFNTYDEHPVLVTDLFLSLKGTFIKSLEFILPYHNDAVLVGTNNGLYSFDLSTSNTIADASTQISQIKYKNEQDSTVYCEQQQGQFKYLKFPYNTSSLIFEFATPKFNSHKDVQYSYKLENVDRHWSEWDISSEKEYSYLKSGIYKFMVKSRTSNGEVSKETAFAFEILPVWYQTKIAYTFFGIIAFLIILLIRILVKRKIKKTRLEASKVQAALQLEIENIKLEKEKANIERDKKILEDDVVHKSKELANYTFLLLKKRDLLAEMSNELKELRLKIKNASNREIIRSMTRRININLQDEEHLNVFDANFERVHQEFFNELKSNFPELSQKELRLCGFVKMNLTNKEIASILNISVRGVETARYRLRKTLSLEKEINIVDFLEKLSSSTDEKNFQGEELNDEFFKE